MQLLRSQRLQVAHRESPKPLHCPRAPGRLQDAARGNVRIQKCAGQVSEAWAVYDGSRHSLSQNDYGKDTGLEAGHEANTSK
eukprot:1947234-Pyramimonas_sp.AAC.1